ncbi:hypothetical protein JCM16303_000901 [Sporobolomyces ruberrimus]
MDPNHDGSSAFSPANFGSLKEQLRAANKYNIVWLAIFFFDYLATLDSEFLNVWKSKLTLYKLFFLAKLAIAVAAELSIMIALSTQLRPFVFPPIAGLLTGFNGCSVVAKDESKAGMIVAVFWSSPLVVAMIFLGLTLHRSAAAMRGSTRMPLYERFVVGQLRYFVVIASTHLVNVALITQRDNPTLQSFNITASIVLTSICCSRLVLGLYTDNQVGSTSYSIATPTTWRSLQERSQPSAKSAGESEEVELSTSPSAEPSPFVVTVQ